MTPDRILQSMSDKPICAALLRARFPKIESDARAERILAGMVESGDLVRTWRGGRTFYRLPDPSFSLPDGSDHAPRARSYRPRGWFGEQITAKLERIGRATSIQLAEAILGKAAVADPAQRKAICKRITEHLGDMAQSGVVVRHGKSAQKHQVFELIVQRSAAA